MQMYIICFNSISKDVSNICLKNGFEKNSVHPFYTKRPLFVTWDHHSKEEKEA
mgnify:CR=1 FL=1